MVNLHSISEGKRSDVHDINEYIHEAREWLNEEKAEWRTNGYDAEHALKEIVELYDLSISKDEIEESTNKASRKVIDLVAHRLAWEQNEGFDEVKAEIVRVRKEEDDRAAREHHDRIKRACSNKEAKKLYDEGERDILKLGKLCCDGVYWIGKYDLDNDPFVLEAMRVAFPEAQYKK